MWCALYSARISPSAFAVFTSIDSAKKRGYEKLLPLEEVVTAHLCPPMALGWKPRLFTPTSPAGLPQPITSYAPPSCPGAPSQRLLQVATWPHRLSSPRSLHHRLHSLSPKQSQTRSLMLAFQNNKKGTSPLHNRISVSFLPLCSDLPIERLKPLTAQVSSGKLSRAWQQCSCSQILSRMSACEGHYRNGPDSSQ